MLAGLKTGFLLCYNEEMKKYIYIFCFVVLGIILQQILHTVIEMGYISLLLRDFDKYGFGWSWDTWFMIHHVYTLILFIIGILWGYWMGKYFWPKLYDEQGRVRYPRPWRI